MQKRSVVADTLRERIVSAQRFGTLDPDGRLPSARVLAEELDVDPRVVMAAYRGLERDGLVERRPGSRSFFAAGHGADRRGQRAAAAAGKRGASRASTTTGERSEGSEGSDPRPVEWLAGVLAQAIERDIPAPRFPERVGRATDTVRLRAVCVECNRDHLTWLCRELHDDYGIDATPLELDALREMLDPPSGADEPGADGPDASRAEDARLPLVVRRADLFVTTRHHADAVAPTAERLGRPMVVVAHREDLTRELERLLAAGPVYFLGTDPRFGAKVRAVYAGRVADAHVRPVILDGDVRGRRGRGGGDPGRRLRLRHADGAGPTRRRAAAGAGAVDAPRVLARDAAGDPPLRRAAQPRRGVRVARARRGERGERGALGVDRPARQRGSLSATGARRRRGPPRRAPCAPCLPPSAGP